MKVDWEMAILLRMYQKGLVKNKYRSMQNVRRSIGWGKMASHCRKRKKFDAIARKLIKSGMLADAGKSAKVLSLSMIGLVRVKEYLKANPDAWDTLNASM